MVRDFISESLTHDPIHGYIPFTSKTGIPANEVSEQEIIDHPWVQRLRHIHQLQTAWWVFPSAEHMRFQHVLGAMHLSSVAITAWYDSLNSACRNVPSLPYVESLVRLAALLHDVGHGPFGHFFDDHYLDQYGLTHEELDPKQIGWLIRRPAGDAESEQGNPDWLCKLRAMFSGIYTVDNMDFVLRDAYMSGYNIRAVDVSRLIHYSFFTSEGLTIHGRGLPALVNFIETRANLFRTIYYHRTVRALDLALEEIFPETMKYLFHGNPLEKLDDYLGFTESSFLVDVGRFQKSSDGDVQKLGERWQGILSRNVEWKMSCERSLNFHSGTAVHTSIFSEPDLVEKRVRAKLPAKLKQIPLRIDIARHYHRPSGRLPAGGQNFLLDPGTEKTQELNDDELFRALPVSFLIFRIYTQDHLHDLEMTNALNAALGEVSDSKTNM